MYLFQRHFNLATLYTVHRFRFDFKLNFEYLSESAKLLHLIQTESLTLQHPLIKYLLKRWNKKKKEKININNIRNTYSKQFIEFNRIIVQQISVLYEVVN